MLPLGSKNDDKDSTNVVIDSGSGGGDGGSRSQRFQHRKYRLRPIGNGHNEKDVYQKYFSGQLAKCISFLQVLIGIVMALIQVWEFLIRGWESTPTRNEIIQIGAAGFVMNCIALILIIVVAASPSYTNMHCALITQILAGIAHMTLTIWLFNFEIPEIQQKQYEWRHSDNGCTQGNCHVVNSTDNLKFFEQNLAYVSGILTEDLEATFGIFAILEFILSILLILLLTRGLCCGRMSLERRFYEISSVGGNSNLCKGPLPPLDLERKCSEPSDGSLKSPCQSPSPFDVSSPRTSQDSTFNKIP